MPRMYDEPEESNANGVDSGSEDFCRQATPEEMERMLREIVVPEEDLTWDPFETLSLEELLTRYPTQRPSVIEGIAREGEVVNLISSSKAHKSWLAGSIALSIANGVDWLGYATQQGRVLLLDNELHYETLSYRLKAIAEAMDLPVQGVDVVSLRGSPSDYNWLHRSLVGGRLAKRLQDSPTPYRAVIVDSHYRMLPQGTSEMDPATIRDVYNQIDRMAEITRAMWLAIHHATKGDQAEKDIIDVGAGTGVQSRTADAHLILRPHHEPGAFVLEGVVRSFPPLTPVALRWRFPLYELASELDPRKLLTNKTRRKHREDGADRDRFYAACTQELQTVRSLSQQLHVGYYRCKGFASQLVAEGKLVEEDFTVSGNPTRGIRRAEGEGIGEDVIEGGREDEGEGGVSLRGGVSETPKTPPPVGGRGGVSPLKGGEKRPTRNAPYGNKKTPPQFTTLLDREQERGRRKVSGEGTDV